LLLDSLIPLIAPGNPSFGPDSAEYNHHALNLLNGKSYGFGFPTVTRGWFRAPGYPFFLYFVYKFIGKSLLTVRIIQAIIGSLTTLIIFLIAKEIFSIRIGIISGIIYALYPYFILQSSYILTECLFTFLYALSVLFILKIIANKSNFRNLLCVGIFAALATLTRNILTVFLPFLAIWLFVSFRKRRILLLKFGIVFLIFSSVIFPWIIYSYFKTGRLIPISTTGAVIFWVGNSENGTAYIFNEKFDPEVRKQFLKDFNTQDDTTWFIKKGIKFIVNRPFLFMKMRFYGFLNFWRILPKVKGHSLLRIFINFLSVTVIPVLGLLGLMKASKLKDKRVTYFIFSFIFFTLIHALVMGIVRYRIPLIDPYLIIFASYFISKIFHLKRHSGPDNISVNVII